jgi:hypothetical protein
MIVCFYCRKNFAVPERIVGQNKSSGSHFGKHSFEVFTVFTFVCINKNQIEGFVDLRNNIECSSDMQSDFMPVTRSIDIFADKILQFVVCLNGVQ